jgi:aminoglycoside phosphotransferase (APT) family kinase protein
MLELTAENAADYLRQRGWISGGFCKVEELSGGVSNIVLRVQTFTERFVLKQSRPQLRTADPWFSDISRVFREIEVMQLLGQRLEEGVVPKILQRDDENFAFLMSHAPRDAQDWRSMLLAGRVDPKLCQWAGRILGRIHETTPADDPALAAFRDKTVFDQLRIDPFYRRVAERCPDVVAALVPLIAESATIEICLCHGDFSPKNLLWHANGFTLVDYETAHLGDPAFDLGFFLSHLFLKVIVHPELWDRFELLFAAFWRGYEDSFSYQPFDFLIGNGIAHLGACLLARVDGTSPAPYLTDPKKKETARRLAKRILLDQLFDWDEVMGLLREECKRS